MLADLPTIHCGCNVIVIYSSHKREGEQILAAALPPPQSEGGRGNAVAEDRIGNPRRGSFVGKCEVPCCFRQNGKNICALPHDHVA